MVSYDSFVPAPVWPSHSTLSHSHCRTAISAGKCQGCPRGLLTTMRIPTDYVIPTCIAAYPYFSAHSVSPHLYLDQPITQPETPAKQRQCSIPTSSPTATRPGLCSSLCLHLCVKRKLGINSSELERINRINYAIEGPNQTKIAASVYFGYDYFIARFHDVYFCLFVLLYRFL